MGFRERGGGPHRLMKGRENGSLNSPSGPGSSTHPTPPNSNGNTGQHQPHSPAPPPQGYICYRCGQKGHWIHACPTNDNPDFEGRPRIKRTTGIPKSFLQKVESGKPVDGQNVMVTSDGSFVIAKPDNATWKQHKSVVVKNLSAADIENQRPSDPDLACALCLKLLKNCVKMVCCSSSFCESCISNYLKSHSSVCPECETKVSFNTSSSSSSSSTSNNNKAFIIDDERRKRSDDYIQEILKISQAAQLEQDKANENQPTPESGPDGKDAESNSKPDDESKPQASKAEESSASDPTAAGSSQTDPSSQQKNDSKSLSSDKPNESNDQSNGKEMALAVISTQVPRPSPTESQVARLTGPGSTGASHMPGMMNGMMDFGNKGFEGYGMTHGMGMNGGDGNMAMMGGMGMNGMGMNNGMGMGMGMGYGGGNGMMEPMMMNGMGGGGHNNAVMNSNQLGFGGGMHAGNGGMAMDMSGGGGQEAMLGMQLHQTTMMLQNPQLNEPMRMQLLMQQQALQQQLAMVQQRMGGGSMMGTHMMNNNMNMGPAGNGMLMNAGNDHHFGHPLGVHHQNHHSFGPFGMANYAGGPHHPLGFRPNPALQPHQTNAAAGGMGMKPGNPMLNQFNHANMGSNFQRPATLLNQQQHLNNNNNNHFNRRPPHLNNPIQQPPSHLQHVSTHAHNHQPKRKRPEDLIELESGEKVPRYM